jgi:hypothetical protein
MVREIATSIKIEARLVALRRLAKETPEIYDELIRCRPTNNKASLGCITFRWATFREDHSPDPVETCGHIFVDVIQTSHYDVHAAK